MHSRSSRTIAATLLMVAPNFLAAQAPAGAPILGLVSSFEDGKTTASFGMGWMVSTDQLAGGKSSAAMKVADGGANGTAKSLDVSGIVAPGLPYAWSGVMFMTNIKPMAATDLSKAREIRFWARGDGATYKIMLFAESKGQAPISAEFVAGEQWKEFVFRIASFDGMDGHDIQGIALTAGPTPGFFSLRIDEFRIQ